MKSISPGILQAEFTSSVNQTGKNQSYKLFFGSYNAARVWMDGVTYGDRFAELPPNYYLVSANLAGISASGEACQVVELTVGFNYVVDGQQGNNGQIEDYAQWSLSWQSVSCPLENHPKFYGLLDATFSITIPDPVEQNKYLKDKALPIAQSYNEDIATACSMAGIQPPPPDVWQTIGTVPSIITQGMAIQTLKNLSQQSAHRLISWLGSGGQIIKDFMSLYYKFGSTFDDFKPIVSKAETNDSPFTPGPCGILDTPGTYAISGYTFVKVGDDISKDTQGKHTRNQRWEGYRQAPLLHTTNN